MNNSDYPNIQEDLQDFLSHPQHWAGTEVHLRLKDSTSVLHFSPLLNKFLWRPNDGGAFCITEVRVGYAHDLVTDLVKEGWVIANA